MNVLLTRDESTGRATLTIRGLPRRLRSRVEDIMARVLVTPPPLAEVPASRFAHDLAAAHATFWEDDVVWFTRWHKDGPGTVACREVVHATDGELAALEDLLSEELVAAHAVTEEPTPQAAGL